MGLEFRIKLMNSNNKNDGPFTIRRMPRRKPVGVVMRYTGVSALDWLKASVGAIMALYGVYVVIMIMLGSLWAFGGSQEEVYIFPFHVSFTPDGWPCDVGW